MTDLRDQLRDARRAYDSAAYPGDLAAELLPPPRPAVRGWIVTLAGAAAVAATFAVALRPAQPDPLAPAQPAGPVVARAVVNVEPTPTTRPTEPPAKPTAVAADDDEIPLPLPAGPLFPAAVPIHVSLSSLQADLSRLGSYPELMPWLREQWESPAAGETDGAPAPKAPSAAPPRTPGEAS